MDKLLEGQIANTALCVSLVVIISLGIWIRMPNNKIGELNGKGFDGGQTVKMNWP